MTIMEENSNPALLVTVTGVVQGVGFRPTVKRLATQLDLVGWVRNTGSAVEILLSGELMFDFISLLKSELPPHAHIDRYEIAETTTSILEGFVIHESTDSKGTRALIPPDIATCPNCLHEMANPHNRRFRYPFINCTNCGPRYTIVHAVPYDRANTSMSSFPLCSACKREYGDPDDRRFHAEPVACPVCGPHLTLTDASGNILAQRDMAIKQVGDALWAGKIVAIKGLGGFHLACDASNSETIQRLRTHKERETKPLAVMARDLATAETLLDMNPETYKLLASASTPIVLAPAKDGAPVAFNALNADTNRLGVLLPYTPIHHLLLAESPAVLVMTSGNLSDEPLATDNQEALDRLGDIADFFLTHNRPIVTPCDDSVLQLVGGKPAFLRRARGYSPGRLHLVPEHQSFPPTLGVGADLKCAPAFIEGEFAYLSPHAGDMDNQASENHVLRLISHIRSLFDLHPQYVAHDLHPDFTSTRIALESELPTIAVQHHHAHLAALLAEHGETQPILALTLDGFGLGSDGTAWGGEILLGNAAGFKRVAHLRSIPLPGGDVASKQGWRMALSVLKQVSENDWRKLGQGLWQEVGEEKAEMVSAMIDSSLNTPLTSSTGRLFDAVAAVLGVCTESLYEGQAAVRLEALALRIRNVITLPYVLTNTEHGLIIDLLPAIMEILENKNKGIEIPILARSYHETLATALVEATERLLPENTKVGLSGGVWNNVLLNELVGEALDNHGIRFLRHQETPPGDGCIGLGQALVGATQAFLKTDDMLVTNA